jgi:hypothetical protein
VAGVGAADGLCRAGRGIGGTAPLFVDAVGNGLAVGVWAGPWSVGQAPRLAIASRLPVTTALAIASRPEERRGRATADRLSTHVGTPAGRAAALRQLSHLRQAHSRRSANSSHVVRAHPTAIHGRLATPLQAPRAATNTAPSVKSGPSIQACVSRYGPPLRYRHTLHALSRSANSSQDVPESNPRISRPFPTGSAACGSA